MTDQTTQRGSGGGPQFEPAFLVRYVTGRATAVEADAVEAWLAADSARGRELEALRRVWDASGHSFSEDEPYIIDQEWARLADMVHGSQSIPTASRRGLRGFPVTDRGMVALPNPWPLGAGGGAARRWGAIGASVVIVLGIGVVIGVARHDARSRATGRREYVTARGQRLNVTLVDGTQFVLAPASRMRLAADYGLGSRGVDLEGEAYFAVVHDAARPFAVRAHGAVARDVGTAFDVRAYPEDVGARIVVADGAVAVSAAPTCRAGGCGTQMRTGDVATVGDGRVAVVHRSDVHGYLAWMQGGLVFEAMPLGQAVRDIGRAFGVEVTVADSALVRFPITAAFTNEPLDEILDAVTRVVGARYERSGRSVVIRRGLAGARPHGDNTQPQLTTARASEAGE